MNVTVAFHPSDQTRLARICRLLHEASTRAWADADKQPLEYGHQDLGLGIYLAYTEVRALLPDDIEMSATERAASRIDRPTALRLLRSAERLARRLPVGRPEWSDLASLLPSLQNLITDARDVGD